MTFGGRFNTKPLIISKYFVVGISRKIQIYTISGKLLNTLYGHEEQVCSLYPFNNRQFLSCSKDGQIILWDVEDSIMIKKWDFEIEFKKVLKQNEFLYAQDSMNIYKIDLKQDFIQIEILYTDDLIQDFQVSKEEEIIVSVGKEIKILKQGQVEIIKNKRSITCICIHEDQLGYGDEEGNIFIQNIKEKEKFQNFLWHATRVNDIEFSFDGNYIFSSGNEGIIVMWSLKQEKKFFKFTSIIQHFSIDESLEYLIGISKDNYIGILELKKPKDIKKIMGIFYQEDEEKRLEIYQENVIVKGLNKIQFFNLEKNQSEQEIYLQFKSLQFNPSRYQLDSIQDLKVELLSFHQDLFASIEIFQNIWNLKFFKKKNDKFDLITTIDQPHQDRITSLNFSNQGICVTTSLDGKVKLWKYLDSSFYCYSILSFKNLKSFASCFSKDGSLLVVSFENILTLWNVQSASLIDSIILSKNQLNHLSFLSDQLLLIKDDQNIFILNILNLNILWKFNFDFIHHLDTNNQLQFIITTNVKNSILFFDLNEKIPLKEIFKTNDDRIESIKFNQKNEILYLNQYFEIINLSKKKEIIQLKDEEELNFENRKNMNISTSLKNDLTIHSYEKNIKNLFSSSFTLSSTSNLFGSFMDHFIKKELEQEEEIEMKEKQKKIEKKEVKYSKLNEQELKDIY